MSLGLLTMAQDEEYLHQEGYEEEEEGLGEEDDEEAELKAKVLVTQIDKLSIIPDIYRALFSLFSIFRDS